MQPVLASCCSRLGPHNGGLHQESTRDTLEESTTLYFTLGVLPLTFPEEVTSATHIRNGLSVALGAAWKESMASRRVGPSYQDDSGPPSVLLDTFSADSPEAGKNRTWWCSCWSRGEGRGSSHHTCQG